MAVSFFSNVVSSDAIRNVGGSGKIAVKLPTHGSRELRQAAAPTRARYHRWNEKGISATARWSPCGSGCKSLIVGTKHLSRADLTQKIGKRVLQPGKTLYCARFIVGQSSANEQSLTDNRGTGERLRFLLGHLALRGCCRFLARESTRSILFHLACNTPSSRQ